MGDTLVTGAAGFIGSWLARRLLDQGHAVLTIDNLSSGDISNIPEGCERIIGDASDPAVIAGLDGRTFDAIYHIAGQSGGIPSFDDPVFDLNSNVTSTLLLLDFACRARCPVFVYASSMSVYGDQEQMPVVESAPTAPQSFYAVGKLASVQYMRLCAERGLACTALRFNNTYGPGQSLVNLRQGMVSIFIGQAVASRRIHVKGRPDRFRDFVHVKDAVESLILAGAPAEGPRFAVYNVATSRKTTVRELIETIRAHLPFPVEVRYEGATPGDQFGIYCGYDRIHADLGWSPTIILAGGDRGHGRLGARHPDSRRDSVKVKAMVAVRAGSVRVPAKNTRPFAGTTLLESKLVQLKRLSVLDGVVVNSDDPSALSAAAELGYEPVVRDPRYATSTMSMSDVYAHMATHCDADVIVYAK